MHYTADLPINQLDVINVYVMFKTRVAVFIGDLKPSLCFAIHKYKSQNVLLILRKTKLIWENNTLS